MVNYLQPGVHLCICVSVTIGGWGCRLDNLGLQIRTAALRSRRKEGGGGGAERRGEAMWTPLSKDCLRWMEEEEGCSTTLQTFLNCLFGRCNIIS